MHGHIRNGLNSTPAFTDKPKAKHSFVPDYSLRLSTWTTQAMYEERHNEVRSRIIVVVEKQ
jgi:hypothetical protein